MAGKPKRLFKAGDRFGRLVLLKHAPKDPSHRGVRWYCCCDCGKVIDIPQYTLTRAKPTVSCGSAGCRGTQMEAQFPKEYKAWKNMKDRCYNPNTPQWKDYGGRGIKVCDSWREDFWEFLHDMGACPAGDHSLDRINNGGDYTSSNCRWATRSEQNSNRRSYRHNSQPLNLTE